MALGELIVGALLVKAFTDKPAQSSSSSPPPNPNAGGGGGIDNSTIGTAGSLAGTAITGLISVFGGGGSGAVGSAGTTGGIAGAAAGTGGAGGAAAAESSAAAVGAGFGGSITAGGVFSIGWLAVFILQFIVIAIVTRARVDWLRYRDTFLDFNKPFLNLHYLELELIRQTCDQLGIPRPLETEADDSALEGSDASGFDPRLDNQTITAQELNQVGFVFHNHRTIMSNPFTGRGAPIAWRYLQMAARLVASRYVFDMGVFARRMLSSFPGLSVTRGTLSWFNSAAEVWAYPLAGGGQPDKSYADFHVELQSYGVQTFPIDDVLKAAHLAGMLHVAAGVSKDPNTYGTWDEQAQASYALNLFNGLGLLAELNQGVKGLQGHLIMLDPVWYRVPAAQLYIDVDNLKAGKPLAPFLQELPGVGLVPTPPDATALVALK